MAEALAVVKVGNRECEFLKLTPLSRTSAIAGAVCGVTIRPRNPSGTNRIRLCGVAFWADAMAADKSVRLADSSASERRIDFSPIRSHFGRCRWLGLVFFYDGFVTSAWENYRHIAAASTARR